MKYIQTIKKMQRKVRPVIAGGAWFALRLLLPMPVVKVALGTGSFAAFNLRKLFGYVDSPIF